MSACSHSSSASRSSSPQSPMRWTLALCVLFFFLVCPSSLFLSCFGATDPAVLAALQSAVTSATPTLDLDASQGRGGGAFATQLVSTSATAQLNHPSLPATFDAFTLHMWLRSPVLNRFVQLVHLEVAPDLTGSASPMSLYTYTDCTLIINGQLISQSLSELPLLDGQWHAFAVTWDSASGTVEFFLDGVSTMLVSGSAQQGATLPLQGATFSIAKRRWGDGFLGSLDDVGMHRSVLSLAQIQQLAALPTLSTTADAPLSSTLSTLLFSSLPVVFYRFDDPTTNGAPGATLTDSSGLGHALVVVGDAGAADPVRVIVPSRAPALASSERWITLPSSSPTARLIMLELAHENNATGVSIDSLTLAGQCELFETDAAGAQGASITAPHTVAHNAGHPFRVLAQCTGTPSPSTVFFDYTTTPSGGSATPFPTRVRIGPNHAPLQMARVTITVDQSRPAAALTTVLQLSNRLYPSIEEFRMSDPDGDDVQVFLVGTSAPFAGQLLQVVGGVPDDSIPPINTSAVSLSSPFLVTSTQSELAYISPLTQFGEQLDNITMVLTDGMSISELVVKRISVTRLPTPPSLSAHNVDVEEGHATLMTLPLDLTKADADDMPFVTISRLPSKGRLYQVLPDGSRGELISLQPPFGGTRSQWVSNVTAISSFYSDTSGAWSDQQILGAPNWWPLAGDNVNAWAAATTDTAEWMELQFDEPVYITRVEVFETFNPKHVYKVGAQRQDETNPHRWQLLWSGTPAPAVPSPADTRANVFVPPLCPLSFPSRRVRLDIASTGPSWAEVDAVRLTGTAALAANVVTDPQYRVWYEADDLASGDDSFAFDANTCDFFSLYRDLGIASKDVSVSIAYHNHAPRPSNASTSWYTDDQGRIAALQFQGIDVDDMASNATASSIDVVLHSLPLFGELFFNGEALTSAMLPLRLPMSSAVFRYEASSFCQASDQLFLDDVVQFALTDGTDASATTTAVVHVYCVEPWQPVTVLLAIVALLCALGLGCVLFFGVLFTFKRHDPVIKASSFLFNLLALAACMGLYLSMLAFVLPASDSWCLARWWLPCCSVTLLLAAIFSKTHRIAKIFTAEKLAVVRLRDADVLQWVGVQLGVTVVLLILYSAIARPRLEFTADQSFDARNDLSAEDAAAVAMGDHLSYGVCSTNDAFRGLLLAYMGLLVVWGTKIAVDVRNVPSQYNEASLLGICVYNLLFCSVLGVPLDFLLQSNPVAQMLMRCFLFFLGSSVIVGTLFAPKALLLVGRGGGRGNNKVHPHAHTQHTNLTTDGTGSADKYQAKGGHTNVTTGGGTTGLFSQMDSSDLPNSQHHTGVSGLAQGNKPSAELQMTTSRASAAGGPRNGSLVHKQSAATATAAIASGSTAMAQSPSGASAPNPSSTAAPIGRLFPSNSSATASSSNAVGSDPRATSGSSTSTMGANSNMPAPAPTAEHHAVQMAGPTVVVHATPTMEEQPQ